MNKRQAFFVVFLVMFFLPLTNSFAENAGHPGDTHYIDVGFFDIHVCNWPDREPFYMGLFSTEKFKDVKSVELMNAQGKKFAALDLEKFRIITRKNKPEKRVFINQIAWLKGHADGWFSAKITLADGTVYHPKDYVEHGLLPIASGFQPAHREKTADAPKALSWTAIKGAAYYQVFIKDKWDEDKLIFSSKILNDPKIVLPKKLLEYGGYYSWRVHARDVNEDIKLGDFNQGSLSAWQEFTIGD